MPEEHELKTGDIQINSNRIIIVSLPTTVKKL